MEEVLELVFSYLRPAELHGCLRVCRQWHTCLERQQVPWRIAFCGLFDHGKTSVEETQRAMLRANRSRAAPYWKQKVADVFPILNYPDGVQIGDLAVPKSVCRSAHSASVLLSADEQDELLLLFGGASHLFIFLDTFDAFNLTLGELIGKRIEPLGDAPSARWLHSACTLRRRPDDQFSRIAIFGGQTDVGFEKDLYMLDVRYSRAAGHRIQVRSTRMVDMPSARAGHSMCYFDDTLLVFGGITVGQQVTNDVYVYSITDDKWARQPVFGTKPPPRWCHSAQLVGRTLLVFGGWSYVTQAGERHTFLNDLHALDVDSMTWREIQTFGEIPRPRCQAPCFHLRSPRCPTSSGYFVVFGGACHNAEANPTAAYGTLVVDLDDFCVLDLDTHLWLPLRATYPRCRGGVNAVAMYSGGIIFSGGMHSDAAAHIPRFKNDLVTVALNLGGALHPPGQAAQYSCETDSTGSICSKDINLDSDS